MKKGTSHNCDDRTRGDTLSLRSNRVPYGASAAVVIVMFGFALLVGGCAQAPKSRQNWCRELVRDRVSLAWRRCHRDSET